MKGSKFLKMLMVCALSTAFLCGCARGGKDGGTTTQLKYDTRGLTPQEYSVANLVATDDYGRKVEVRDPTNAEKKYVGVFYFLWLGSQGMTGIYDVNKLEKLGDDSPLYDTDDQTGQSPTGQFHFASEPLYGYYSMRDPWVITRHVELLTMANIDYIMFDCTNTLIYEDVVKLVLETLKTYADQGWNVPKVAFYTNSSSADTVRRIYNAFYVSGQYDSLWFRFDGDTRPVIVGISSANIGSTDQSLSSGAGTVLPTSDPLYSYYNFYESQWPSAKTVDDEKGFPWMQWGSPAPHANGNASVSVAQHSESSVFFSDQLPNSSRGYNGLTVEEDWRQGANFNWQWQQAFAYDKAGMVKNVFVTGWNEWTAIKSVTGQPGGGNSTSGYTGKDIWFVDDYNAEYSRDIEMGKEYGDGFYIQLTANTHNFKMGESTKYKMVTKTIDIQNLDDWKNILLEYADFSGDAMARDGENAANVAHSYVDNSNRNDIVSIKVVHDAEYVYFRVDTKDPITAYNGTDTNWMNLLIGAGDTTQSFAGFNYIINRKPGENGTTSIEKCTQSGFNWTDAGTAETYVSGNMIVYKIPLSALGLSGDDVSLSFKVCDNVQKQDDILDYYITGDSAPIGRFGYAYGM